MKKSEKKIAKILSVIVLTFVMMVSVVSSVLAATVTVDTASKDGILAGHRFKAYQIFSGVSSGGTLTEIDWGNGITDVNTALKVLKTGADTGWIKADFQAAETAQDVADVLVGYAEKSDLQSAEKFAKVISRVINNGNGIELQAGENDLEDGYYLIIDISHNTGNYDSREIKYGGALNTSILQVVGDNIEITVKTDAPTLEKKVKENEKADNSAEYGNKYNDAADYNIGDYVPFKLIGSIPDLTHFESYQYRFHDILSLGLTADKDSIKVYASTDKIVDNTDTDITDDFVVSLIPHKNDDGKIDGNELIIEQGEISSKIRNDGRYADVKYILVEYYAQLNENAIVGQAGNPNKAFLQYSVNPNGDGCYRTPVDTVMVFTYELDVNKVDAGDHSKKLDAEFKLRNHKNEWLAVDENGKVRGWETDEQKASVLKSGANGFFSVTGLDDGTYYLKETAAPTGYNLLKDELTVTVSAETNHIQNWDGIDTAKLLEDIAIQIDAGKKISGDVQKGIVTMDVENSSGAILPETGGIGTTLFYVFGVLLAGGAAVLLVFRKKAGEKE